MAAMGDRCFFCFRLATVVAVVGGFAGGEGMAAPVAGSGSGGATASRLPAGSVVERVQKRYDAARDFRAKFTQTLTSVAVNRKTQSAGEVLLKKPGLMRWNYQSPEEKMYLSDGRLLWLYEPEDQQAFKQDLKTSQLPAALVFLTGTGKLSEQFEISLLAAKDVRVGAPRDYVLSLLPRQAQPQIKTILFVVDPGSFDVRETIITDSQGNQNDLLFSDIRTNTRIPAETFHWTPPSGVRVVDTAKLGR
jgi:outer membrane lipoprotein carrier protein